MSRGHKNKSSQGMLPAPDWREALLWFVNTYGLYAGSTRGLFLSDWSEEQAVSLESALINLKSRGFSPFVVSGETLYQQADFLFEESKEKSSFGRPLASKVELELSGNEIVIVDGLEAPEKPSHLWYLIYYLLMPRINAGKVSIFTTALSYPEFLRYGEACRDFDFCGSPINWEKVLFLLESCTINQDLYKLAREESAPPMLRAEYELYKGMKDRGLDAFPQYVLSDYLLDFALMQGSRRLNIEVDTLSALAGHELNTRESKRDFVLLSDGWQIVKFSALEIINNVSSCVDVVEDVWRDGRRRCQKGRLFLGTDMPVCPELPADDAQRNAIIYGGGPLALVGGAGTGKSTCIVKRAAYLLSQGISPESLLLCSYSQDAARILKDGLEQVIDKQQSQKIYVCSLHDLGTKILKENLAAAKRKPPIKIEPSPEKVIQKILSKVRKDVDAVKLEMAGEIDEFYASAMIAMYKAHLISPSMAKEDAQGAAEEVIARVYQLYEEQLQKTNRVDKYDVIGLSVKILLENVELRRKYQGQFEYLLVDEYQELTVAQDMLIRLLAAPQDNLFAAGDEDETISENRNACPELLADFSLRFPNARCIIVEQNWRCHPAIVEHAAWIIAYLERHKIRKEFHSAWGSAPSAAIFGPQACVDENEEAAYIASQVKALIDAGRPAADIAVLYKQSHYESIFEEKLRELSVRFSASPQDNSLIPDEVGDMLAFLKLVMDPDGPKAREAFERVCQLGTKEIDPKLSATIASFAGANNLSYLKAIEIYAEATADQSCRELEQLVRIIRAMNQDRLPPSESIGYLRRTRRLNDYYRNIKIPPGLVYEPLKRLSKMEEDARKFNSVQDFVQHIEERGSDDDERAEQKAVSIKSIYDVKGFEFPIVFLCGLSEGLMPSSNSADLEEERRQFYVAFTRAREAIYLSYPASLAGRELSCSRFLVEARLVQVSSLQTQPVLPAPVPEKPAPARAENLPTELQAPDLQALPAQENPVHPAAALSPQTSSLLEPEIGAVLDEKRSTLAPYVDNPEPAPQRGMNYLPPSKGQAKSAPAKPEPSEEAPPEPVRPEPYSMVPPGPPTPGKTVAPGTPPHAGSPGKAGAVEAEKPAAPEFSWPLTSLPETKKAAKQEDYDPGMDPANWQIASEKNQPLEESQTPGLPAGVPYCPSCGNALEVNARFCGECGYSLPERIIACSACQSPLEPSSKFCGECGTPVPQAPMENEPKKGWKDKFLKFPDK